MIFLAAFATFLTTTFFFVVASFTFAIFIGGGGGISSSSPPPWLRMNWRSSRPRLLAKPSSPRTLVTSAVFWCWSIADLLLHRIAREESVSDHLVLLTNPVGPVDRLVLDRRVPPGIVEDHVGGRGQVQTRSTSLQGEQEHGGILRRLEVFDLSLPVLGLTGEVVEWTTLDLELRLDDVQHRHELREDEHLVALLAKLIEQVEKRRHLGALLLEELRIDQTRVTTNLTQTHQTLQNRKAVLLHRFVRIEPEQRLLDPLQLRLVHVALNALHLRINFLLGPRRQILRHLRLGPAQQERTQARGKADLRLRILALVEALLEVSS